MLSHAVVCCHMSCAVRCMLCLPQRTEVRCARQPRAGAADVLRWSVVREHAPGQSGITWSRFLPELPLRPSVSRAICTKYCEAECEGKGGGKRQMNKLCPLVAGPGVKAFCGDGLPAILESPGAPAEKLRSSCPPAVCAVSKSSTSTINPPTYREQFEMS